MEALGLRRVSVTVGHLQETGDHADGQARKEYTSGLEDGSRLEIILCIGNAALGCVTLARRVLKEAITAYLLSLTPQTRLECSGFHGEPINPSTWVCSRPCQDMLLPPTRSLRHAPSSLDSANCRH